MSGDDSQDGGYSELSLSELSGAMNLEELRKQADGRLETGEQPQVGRQTQLDQSLPTKPRPPGPKPPPPIPGGQIVEVVDEDFEPLLIDEADQTDAGATQIDAAVTQIDGATQADAAMSQAAASGFLERPNTGLQSAFGERRRRRKKTAQPPDSTPQTPGPEAKAKAEAKTNAASPPVSDPGSGSATDYFSDLVDEKPRAESDVPPQPSPSEPAHYHEGSDSSATSPPSVDQPSSDHIDRASPTPMRLATNPQMQAPSTRGGPVDWLLDPDNRLVLIVLLGALVITTGVLLAIVLSGDDEGTAGGHEKRQEQEASEAVVVPPVTPFIKTVATATAAGIYTPTPGVVRYTVIGIPTDANVFLGDELYCEKTPCAVGVDETLESAILTVSLEGYIDGMVEVTPASDTGKIPVRVVLEPVPEKKK